MVYIKLNYFSGRPNKAKEMFWNIFDWPLCWLLKNSSISVTRPVLGGSVHTGWYIHNSLVHIANICIIYLHVIDAFLKVIIAMLYFCHLKNSSNIMKKYFNSISIYLKVIIAMLYFCHSKNSSNIMKKYFNSISIYSWKKNFLVNKWRKQMRCELFYKQHFYKQRQAEIGKK